ATISPSARLLFLPRNAARVRRRPATGAICARSQISKGLALLSRLSYEFLEHVGARSKEMAEERDSLAYLMLLAALTVVILVVAGWFTLVPNPKRIARDCNIITLADNRSSDCRPSENRSRD